MWLLLPLLLSHLEQQQQLAELEIWKIRINPSIATNETKLFPNTIKKNSDWLHYLGNAQRISSS